MATDVYVVRIPWRITRWSADPENLTGRRLCPLSHFCVWNIIGVISFTISTSAFTISWPWDQSVALVHRLTYQKFRIIKLIFAPLTWIAIWDEDTHCNTHNEGNVPNLSVEVIDVNDFQWRHRNSCSEDIAEIFMSFWKYTSRQTVRSLDDDTRVTATQLNLISEHDLNSNKIVNRSVCASRPSYDEFEKKEAKTYRDQTSCILCTDNETVPKMHDKITCTRASTKYILSVIRRVHITEFLIERIAGFFWTAFVLMQKSTSTYRCVLAHEAIPYWAYIFPHSWSA